MNDELTSWKLPDNEFTATEKVTLRRLLSHSGGVNVHGYSGYEVDQPLPSVVQILDGVKPANSPPGACRSSARFGVQLLRRRHDYHAIDDDGGYGQKLPGPDEGPRSQPYRDVSQHI